MEGTRFNRSKDCQDKISYQMAGRRLSAMGFRKVRHEHNSAVVWDQELIRRLTKTYGLEEPVVDFGNDPESAF